MNNNMKIIEDFKKITFKQLIQLSFFWIAIGFVGVAAFETWHYHCIRECIEFCNGCDGYNCNICTIPAVMRWVFVGIFAFAGLRNLFGGAIPNLIKDIREWFKK